MTPFVYLDHLATTPVDPLVLETLLPYFSKSFGNPHSAYHCYGWQAAEAVELARKQVAHLLGAKSSEIVFTSGASEANNLALKGVAALFPSGKAHIISVVTEHSSVLKPLASLQSQGYSVTLLPVNDKGLIDLNQLTRAIKPDTRLISIMFANNETGVLQPIPAIGELAKQAGILFHCDATQAIGKLAVDVTLNAIDLLTLSAHKFYGPKGIGALYVRKTEFLSQLLPQIHGGGQEAGLRSGTLNVPGIVGLGAACALADRLMTEEAQRLGQLRDRLQNRITEALPNITVNSNIKQRLQTVLSLSIADVEGESLLHNLRHVALSTGSTCGGNLTKTSHVLHAMGIPDDLARATLRLSLGRFNTEDEIDFAAEHIVAVVNKLRQKAHKYPY